MRPITLHVLTFHVLSVCFSVCVIVTTVSLAETTELIELPFEEMQT